MPSSSSYNSFAFMFSSLRAVLASLLLNEYRLSCRLTRRSLALSANILHCCPILICSKFMTIKIAEWPSLNIPAARYADNSTIFLPECRCLGFKRHTVALKDSLVFCVCPPKQRVKSSSLDSFSYIGWMCFSMFSSMTRAPCLYVESSFCFCLTPFAPTVGA